MGSPTGIAYVVSTQRCSCKEDFDVLKHVLKPLAAGELCTSVDAVVVVVFCKPYPLADDIEGMNDGQHASEAVRRILEAMNKQGHYELNDVFKSAWVRVYLCASEEEARLVSPYLGCCSYATMQAASHVLFSAEA